MVYLRRRGLLNEREFRTCKDFFEHGIHPPRKIHVSTHGLSGFWGYVGVTQRLRMLYKAVVNSPEALFTELRALTSLHTFFIRLV